MKVRVTELRRAASVLFDHLEEIGCDEIELDQDYYWNVPDEKLYNVYEEPSVFDIGQLSDDLANIKRFGNGQSPPIAFGLVWLAAILRFIGGSAASVPTVLAPTCTRLTKRAPPLLDNFSAGE